MEKYELHSAAVLDEEGNVTMEAVYSHKKFKQIETVDGDQALVLENQTFYSETRLRERLTSLDNEVTLIRQILEVNN